jgi:hypothetical protein
VNNFGNYKNVNNFVMSIRRKTRKTRIMKAIHKWLNKHNTPTSFDKNTYTPPMGVNDANRKEHFNNYNVELMNRIRDIKLNQVNK